MKNQDKSKEEIITEVYLKGLNFLSYRPRTEHELVQRLKKYTEKYVETLDTNKVVDEVLTRFKDEGFVDDARFCTQVITSLQIGSRPKSKREVEIVLIKKGVNKEIISLALESLDSSYEEKSLEKLKNSQISLF